MRISGDLFVQHLKYMADQQVWSKLGMNSFQVHHNGEAINCLRWLDHCWNSACKKAKISTVTSDHMHPSGGLRTWGCNSFCDGDKLKKFCQEGRLKEALHTVKLMVEQTNEAPVGAYICISKLCARRKALAEGKQLHALIVQNTCDSNIVLANNLVDMYSKCGSVVDAQKVFTRMPYRNVFSWTAIISAYADSEQYEEAINLFWQMQKTGIAPDKVAFVIVLKACAKTAALEQGKQLHLEIRKRHFDLDMVVQNTLIDMYAKCGCLLDARELFNDMNQRNVFSWNAIIQGYVQNGLGKEAIALYNQMRKENVLPDKVTFVIVLKACARTSAVEEGKQLHAEIRERCLESDVNLQNTLVDMYARCGYLQDARRLFDNMSERHVASWNAMIHGYVQNDLVEEAFALYEEMKQNGVQPDKVTFVVVLKACAMVSAVEQGKQLHQGIRKRGLDSNAAVQSSLVNMYAKCGCLDTAREIFNNMQEQHIASWNAMIQGYAQNGLGKEAIALYDQMKQKGVQPDKITFIVLLTACARIAAAEQGKKLHSEIRKNLCHSDMVVQSALIDMYAKCGCLNEARDLFNNMGERNTVSWNAMIHGYVQNGLGEKALALYDQITRESVKPDKVTFIVVLKACASITALERGKQLHSEIRSRGLEADVVVQSSLVDMYAKCGDLESARKLFITMSEHNVVSWNAMIQGYVQNGLSNEALTLLEQMEEEGVQPNKITFIIATKACTSNAALEQGKQLHLEIRKRGFDSDVIVQGSLIDMYAKLGCLDDARKLFNNISERDVVLWSAMIQGYLHNGFGKEALDLYEQMKQEGVQPDKVTFLVVVNACAGIAALEEGKQIHSEIKIKGFVSDVVVQNALIDMYVKCGCLDDACELFNSMGERNAVSWSTIIQGYVQNGLGKEALALYERMKQEGLQPDKVTFIVALRACAIMGALEQGKQLHLEIRKRSFESDVIVQNTLVDMYAKCGCLGCASDLFNAISERNVVSWNTMIQGYLQNGLGKEALDLYEQMKKEGVQPDKVTYMCLLSACSHSGMVAEGHHVFDSMCENHGVKPTLEHYSCMVDLLSRAGCLANAQDFFYENAQ